MPGPAAVVGDKLVGVCLTHLTVGPLGAPVPAPPMPFNGLLTLGMVPTVLIAGKPALALGASGMTVPPHVGLHPADPFFAPPVQTGVVTTGSATVLLGGRPAVRTGDTGLCCGVNSGVVVGSAATVVVGG